MRTIADTMQQSEICKGMLTEIDKILKIYFTIPVTSATAERYFSALRRIKTFLRTSMTHCRLNNLFLLYVHVTKTDSFDLKAVARDFVHVNSWRIHYFGKLWTVLIFITMSYWLLSIRNVFIITRVLDIMIIGFGAPLRKNMFLRHWCRCALFRFNCNFTCIILLLWTRMTWKKHNYTITYYYDVLL